MTSAELRRIVEAMTRPSLDRAGLVVQIISLDGPHGEALVTLANHATALVALLEACEQLERACTDENIPLATHCATEMRIALAAVHATT